MNEHDNHAPERAEHTGGEHGGAEGGSSSHAGRHTRWLYARVLIIQAAALIALYLLQAAYGSG